MALTILCMPPELWARIFLCIGRENSIIIDARFLARLVVTFESPALILASVCSYWREIALSTRQLWSSIRVKARGEVHRLDENRSKLEIVNLWLERLGGAPLDFELCIDPTYSRPFGPHTQTEIRRMLVFADIVLSYLKARSVQWRNVRVLMPSHLVSAFLPRPERNLPMLEHVHVDILRESFDSGPEPEENNPLAIAFNHAPQLNSFSMAMATTEETARFSLPWYQIRHLQFSLPAKNLETCLELLPMLYNLSELYLDLPVFSFSEESYEPTSHKLRSYHCQLPHLRVLVFKSPYRPLFDVLQSLDLPQLYSMDITTVFPHNDTALLDILSRFPLTELTVQRFYHHWNFYKIPDALVSDILARIPSVESMRVPDQLSAGINNLLQRLTYNPSSPDPPIAPSLRKLEVRLDPSLKEEYLVKMLKSRCCSGSTPGHPRPLDSTPDDEVNQTVNMVQGLKTITMHGKDRESFGTQTLQAVDNLVAAGLQVIWS